MVSCCATKVPYAHFHPFDTLQSVNCICRHLIITVIRNKVFFVMSTSYVRRLSNLSTAIVYKRPEALHSFFSGVASTMIECT